MASFRDDISGQHQVVEYASTTCKQPDRMFLRKLKYVLVYLTPILVWVSLSGSGYTTFLALITLFGVLPLAELFLKGSKKNLTAVEESLAVKDPFYDLLLYSLVPIQYCLLGYFLYRIAFSDLTIISYIGITIAMGLSCGILGINAAHELGHRSTRFEQTLSKLLLLTSLYLHFFIEHNRGHHKHVSTPDDPASARKNEMIYAFYLRTLSGSWRSAWYLEAQRLRKQQRKVISIANQMLQFQLLQSLIVLLIWICFGTKALLLFLVAACIGILLLESVNYIEHYALSRKMISGKYERTGPEHSWNSNHPLGRLILLELSRHSDHHFAASRKYQILRHFDESPQMPTGYPGMILLSLFPPAWFAVMNRTAQNYYEMSSRGEMTS